MDVHVMVHPTVVEFAAAVRQATKDETHEDFLSDMVGIVQRASAIIRRKGWQLNVRLFLSEIRHLSADELRQLGFPESICCMFERRPIDWSVVWPQLERIADAA